MYMSWPFHAKFKFACCSSAAIRLGLGIFGRCVSFGNENGSSPVFFRHLWRNILWSCLPLVGHVCLAGDGKCGDSHGSKDCGM